MDSNLYEPGNSSYIITLNVMNNSIEENKTASNNDTR